MILRVTQYGEPILRKVGAEVVSFDERLRTLARDMIETMYQEEGVGLAAQQVGEALLLFVMDPHVSSDEADFDYLLDGKKQPLELIMPMVVVNPKVTPVTEAKCGHEEGCLSFPGIRGWVERPTAVRLEFQDTEGVSHILEAAGFLARIIQHENDHVHGILFIDTMDKRDLLKNEAKIKKLKRESRDFQKQNKKDNHDS